MCTYVFCKCVYQVNVPVGPVQVWRLYAEPDECGELQKLGHAVHTVDHLHNLDKAEHGEAHDADRGQQNPHSWSAMARPVAHGKRKEAPLCHTQHLRGRRGSGVRGTTSFTSHHCPQTTTSTPRQPPHLAQQTSQPLTAPHHLARQTPQAPAAPHLTHQTPHLTHQTPQPHPPHPTASPTKPHSLTHQTPLALTHQTPQPHPPNPTASPTKPHWPSPPTPHSPNPTGSRRPTPHHITTHQCNEIGIRKCKSEDPSAHCPYSSCGVK